MIVKSLNLNLSCNTRIINPTIGELYRIVGKDNIKDFYPYCEPDIKFQCTEPLNDVIALVVSKIHYKHKKYFYFLLVPGRGLLYILDCYHWFYEMIV